MARRKLITAGLPPVLLGNIRDALHPQFSRKKLRAGIHLEPYPILRRILVKRTDSTGIFLFISRIARNTGSIVIDIDTVLPNSRSLTILAIRTLLRRTTNFKAISSKSDQRLVTWYIICLVIIENKVQTVGVGMPFLYVCPLRFKVPITIPFMRQEVASRLQLLAIAIATSYGNLLQNHFLNKCLCVRVSVCGHLQPVHKEHIVTQVLIPPNSIFGENELDTPFDRFFNSRYHGKTAKEIEPTSEEGDGEETAPLNIGNGGKNTNSPGHPRSRKRGQQVDSGQSCSPQPPFHPRQIRAFSLPERLTIELPLSKLLGKRTRVFWNIKNIHIFCKYRLARAQFNLHGPPPLAKSGSAALRLRGDAPPTIFSVDAALWTQRPQHAGSSPLEAARQ
ncbi:unnamed protein product [Nesidiocoris tenuis]|uniref:Uncharacterized protein n=1 Tax=Nesidiocoris tenuis TaxID=355587 RepID=A0A6H5FYU6_9HEMI|nr:unnamed protein product [Nesidiocoris tenuis]